jgi:nitrite reductase/ring-hydroxylating ferredoxin subunit
MPEVIVGRTSDFGDPGRKVVDIEGSEVGVFRLGSDFFAYYNICPHLDGPACQGKILPCATEDVQPDRTSAGRVFSKTQINVVCPWHGFEFDIRTGRHQTDKRIRLRPVSVKVRDGDVIVSLPNRN